MQIDAQILAVRASQVGHPIERQLLDEVFVGPPAPTSSPGVNATKRLALSGGAVVFHKPFAGVHVANALASGQTDETPPLHDAVGWRLPVALGEPWLSLVSPCVLRDYAGEDGALSLQASGWPGDLAPTLNLTWCLPAAFFDSLAASRIATPTAVSDVHAKVVGRELRETRHALGLTQAEVAGRLGVSPSYVSAVEAGKRNLTLAQLANIANAMRLGIEVSFIRPDGTPIRLDQASARD
jgi:DNA-binding XRE family transcriptional regulator